MIDQWFFEKFELIADAPDAVARMRELVLELAVQGRLVDQFPAEGDGYALLKQIQQLNTPAKVDKSDDATDLESHEHPSHWASSTLGEVAEIVRGVSFPGSAKSNTRSKSDVACLRTASVQAEIDWNDLIYIDPTHVSRSDQWVTTNDILISMANSYALVGKVAIVRDIPEKATFGAFLAAIRPILIDPFFLLYVLRCPRMQAAFRASSSQTTNIANISLGRMRPLPFPLPPLAEQKRIVAKVDELMSLCDQLEAQQQERETRKSVLVRASLARFAQAPTPANLEFLFHNSYHIPPAELRKSILTLAVQGKLVPQDSEDIPVKDILTYKKALTVLHANVKSLSASLGDQGVSYEDVAKIPANWAWCGIDQLVISLRDDIRTGPFGSSLHKHDHKTSGIPVWGIESIDKNGRFTGRNKIFVDERKANELVSFSVRSGDIILSRSGTVGELCRLPNGVRSGLISTNLIKISLNEQVVLSDFFCLLFKGSQTILSQLSQLCFGSTRLFLTQKILAKLFFPIPPLAEQRRIVARVDQLMALVDELEREQEASRTTAAKLLDAIVHELTSRN